tara:strand:+ start:477 stop:839 length:363 start_codon:yes stop_codon:yes gene_type:complete
MSAGRYDITIEQGATFTLPISYKDSNDAVINLSSNYTARMRIKESHGGSLLASTESGDSTGATITVTLAASGNNVTISMTATNTAALNFDSAVYDLELVSGSEVDRLLEGRVKLKKEVTV